MKTTIGGDRLGSGNKQEVSMRSYSRSTHDLSYLWRSSMSSGTLVPFLNEVGLPGDSFDIDLGCEVLTLPTVGPLFGSYKVQLDVFSCPMRLYNGKLHMNKLGIGMDMSKIQLPQLIVNAGDVKAAYAGDNEQINSSCIFSYLGIRGLGRPISGTGRVSRRFNAIPYLSYWDVYKQYYANKQEEEGVMIHIAPGTPAPWALDEAYRIYQGNSASIYLQAYTFYPTQVSIEYKVRAGSGSGIPDWSQATIYRKNATVLVTDYWPNMSVSEDGLTCLFNGATDTQAEEWLAEPQLIDGSGIPLPDSKPQLARFPLENIDLMREDILKAVSDTTAFEIDGNTRIPYGSALSESAEDEIFAKQYAQEGLAIKTYQSDLFNNWISTEWIDGTNGVNEVTAVDTSSGQFTIDALNLANKVYVMLNRIAISGGTYDDWLDAVYTHERTRSVENPVYQGSLIKELSFQEVVSTGDTTEQSSAEGGQPLGTLAGRGKLTSKNKGGRIKVKIDEPSVILGIASITPRIDYSQGNKWSVNLKTMNDLHKPQLDAIGYQDLVTDQMAWFDTKLGNDNSVDPVYKSAGKQPAWINYMTNVNEVRGSFAEQNNQMFMVLNRRYEKGSQGIEDLTTYVDPSKFNHIFADTRIDAQNFWVQISNKITARRKMSAKVIPNL